jgi:transposase
MPPTHAPNPVRKFGTYTPDLQTLADWLAACQIKTVAMESTGVYWIPLFELLEARGFEVAVVNARHLQHVTGARAIGKIANGFNVGSVSPRTTTFRAGKSCAVGF